MKNLKKLLFVGLLSFYNIIFCQSDCEKDKQDLAQIISGSYKCEISTTEYGGDGSDKKSQGIITISKISKNKIKISGGAVTFTISDLKVDGNTVIYGDEPAPDNNGSKLISLNIYDKPVTIIGCSSNATSEKEKKMFSFEGTSTDNNKPESLNSEPACKEIYVNPNAKFGGKIIKKRDFKLCILGVAYDKPGTIDVKKAAEEQQVNDVLILDIPFPEDEAWENSDYEVQTKRYWDETNKPFIDDAIAQNAEIRYVTDPRLEENKYSKKKPKNATFNTTPNSNSISKVLRYGYFEYKYLTEKGYKLDESTGLMKK